jgi:hypothetical protein
MSVCLRCDWQGDVSGDACPRCGAPLFRPEPPRARRSPVASVRPDRLEQPGAELGRTADAGGRLPEATGGEMGSAPGHAPSAVRRAAAWAVAAMLAVAAVVAIDVLSPPERRSPAGSDGRTVAPPPLTGSLVYSRRSPTADRLQLWRWDLEIGAVEPGPIVPKPFHLVASTSTDEARIGLTWRNESGTLSAGVVDPYDDASSPEAMISGDLIAWSPRGTRVSSATLARTSPCPRWLVIRAVRIEQRAFDRSLRMRTCGEVLTLAGDGVVTYFTLRRDGRAHIAYGGLDRPAIVLRNHALLGISWAGDMIVQSTAGSSAGELAYFSRRTTEPDPRPVPFNGDTSFAFGGVLAWAPNSFEALVVGTTAGRPSPTPGVYLLDTLPGDGIDPPRWLMEASGPTSATYTGDGVGIVLTGGRVFAYADGVVTEVPLPLGAPLADGRVAWIP